MYEFVLQSEAQMEAWVMPASQLWEPAPAPLGRPPTSRFDGGWAIIWKHGKAVDSWFPAKCGYYFHKIGSGDVDLKCALELRRKLLYFLKYKI